MASQALTLPYYRYSGRIRDDDPRHAPVLVKAKKPANAVTLAGVAAKRPAKARRITAPLQVKVPGMTIPQWGKTVEGLVRGFNPAKDCRGNFMPFKNQPNNNCYNYACNVATNTCAQPGRKHAISAVNSQKQIDTRRVIEGALKDGLRMISRKPLSMKELAKRRPDGIPGHFVALLIAPPNSRLRWPGDFHWVRCDKKDCTSWSQKTGSQHVVNFDFSGKPLVDPLKSSWGFNAGLRKDGKELFVTYRFKAWMYVPFGEVDII